MNRRWALISGAKGTRKSETATRLAELLGARGLTVGGVVQQSTHESDDRVLYRARRLGEPPLVIPLARRGSPPEGARPEAACTFCSFVFDRDAFTEAGGWIREAAAHADVVVIDEVSKLEVSRGGHHDAIAAALGERALVVLVVRADQLFAVVERFELEDAVATLELGDDADVEGFADVVAAAARDEARPS